MKKKLYVVRHGQTLFNQKGLIQGQCDSPLTPMGHEQARKTRKYMQEKGMDFDYAACSDLGRTEQTLKDITDLPYDRLSGLREFFYGDLEGEPASVVQGKKIDLETFYKAHGGESRSEVEKRMLDTVQHVMTRPDVHNALLVSHGSSGFRLASAVDEAKARKMRKFANCVIYEYTWEDGALSLDDIVDTHVTE